MMNVQERTIDQWLQWKPKWTGKQKTPHDLQEKHAPAVKLPDGSVRRLLDARLWLRMSHAQQEAAMEIATSFELASSGLGYKNSNWLRQPNCGYSNMTDARAELVNIYFEWARKCTLEKISHAMIIDVLCFGHACRAVDRARRMKNGTAQKYLLRGLSLYCELRGWA